ncbi:aminoglycoside phosphotransferase family protein [Saccharothrix violaceirubra]|uniref:Streptomycin 6-kinase n=1 Tax=Saccharothrix violaceirubra TaxID=413306 RepID=A0A7W7WYK6_9PSEU|nr:aminoglycoside phosphotransferase family protein [Saccharothrix violaceirubra]MBB4968327.1 streptomycin 6-kinase [Saccharothrix violaceirubra]
MITAPADFAVDLGAEARRWRDTLPALATRYCSRWALTPDGDPMFGYVAAVLPVRRADGHPAVLKLTWLDEETRSEPLALATWNGDGAVLLLDHDDADGALLLERLDADHSLADEPIAAALAVIGGLVRRLTVPAPAGLRRVVVDDLAARNRELGTPVEPRVVDHAAGMGRELAASAAHLLVNEDLHYGNVLRASREPWLVIDPKPLSGDPEYGVIPLLWNRLAELDGERGLRDRRAAVVAAAGLDPDRTRAWTYYRAVVNHLWAVEVGDRAFADRLAAITRSTVERAA